MAKKKETEREAALAAIEKATSIAELRTLIDNMDVGLRNSLGAAVALRMDALVGV